jgi:hypothetical protein
MINTYETGNTVQLRATFKDIDGVAKDPSLPSVKVYDRNFNKIFDFPLGAGNRTKMGEYFVNYTIPYGEVKTTYYYEFYGELEGTPSLNRGSFVAKFYEA